MNQNGALYMNESASDEEEEASSSPGSAVSTPTWQEGRAGEIGSGERQILRCSTIRTTLFCSYLNAEIEQVPCPAWLKEVWGDGDDLERVAGAGGELGVAARTVSVDLHTWYSTPIAV